MYINALDYIFLITSAELVPPNPNEFERMYFSSRSVVSFAMLSRAESSSGFSKFIFGATKLFCIIMMEYTISDAPAIQHS